MRIALKSQENAQMFAVYTPYNLVGLQINGGRIYLPLERYLEDLGLHYIPLANSLSDGECEYPKQPEVPPQEGVD